MNEEDSQIKKFQKQLLVAKAIEILNSPLVQHFIIYDEIMTFLLKMVNDYAQAKWRRVLKQQSLYTVKLSPSYIVDTVSSSYSFNDFNNATPSYTQLKNVIMKERLESLNINGLLLDQMLENLIITIRETYLRRLYPSKEEEMRKKRSSKVSSYTSEIQESPLDEANRLVTDLMPILNVVIHKRIWSLWMYDVQDLLPFSLRKEDDTNLLSLFFAFRTSDLYQQNDNVEESPLIYPNALKKYYILSVFLWCAFDLNEEEEEEGNTWQLVSQGEYASRLRFILLYNNYLHYDQYVTFSDKMEKILIEHPDKSLYKLDLSTTGGMVLSCIYDGVDGSNGDSSQSDYGGMSKRERKSVKKVKKRKGFIIISIYHGDISYDTVEKHSIPVYFHKYTLGMCFQCYKTNLPHFYEEECPPFNQFCSKECQIKWHTPFLY